MTTYISKILWNFEALIQNNKQFEFMAYPDKNHGIYGGQTRPQLYKKK